MKKSVWILAILYGCGGGSSSSSDPSPSSVSETCAANVIWEAPSLRHNGLPLSPDEFDKFTIYVGDTPGRKESDLIMVIDVTDKTAITHRIDGLPYQKSYIYLTVTDTEGEISPHSPEWSWDCVIGELYEGEENGN